MVEWFKAPVLKTGVGVPPPRVRIPLSPPFLSLNIKGLDMYEDCTIEDRYLKNFSQKEKEIFYHQQTAKQKALNRYKEQLLNLVYSDSNAIFSNDEPKPNTALEIKYILNRIAANDPRDKSFTLGAVDSVYSVWNSDRLALDIARAFRTNTMCKTIILSDLGLTDKGMMPILRTLRQKELDTLDIRGNKISAESIETLDHILADPKTKWKRVVLGKIKLTPEQNEALSKYANLYFMSAKPLAQHLRESFGHILNPGNER